jgi:signal transduction histidine kinase
MTIRTDQPESRLHKVGPWLVANPRLLRVVLDLVFVLAAVGAFAQLWDPDVLFHLIWVVLTLEAFLFGLRPTGARIAIAGLLLLAYFNLATIQTSPNEIMVLDLAEWPLMLVIAVIVAVMADRLATTSRHYAELYRKASDQLLTAQEGERRRLGMDLHDGVGQTLTALVLTLDAAESDLWADASPGPPRGATAIHRAQELAAIALDETRDVAYRLRPDRLVETGLVAATERLAAASGAPTTVVADPGLKISGLLEPEDEMNVYRIVQEALNNAVSHSGASHVEITFRVARDHLTATVSDDGAGFDPNGADHQGLGMAGMRERAIVLRSNLVVRSRPGRGTTISVTAPLRADQVRALPGPTSPYPVTSR